MLHLLPPEHDQLVLPLSILRRLDEVIPAGAVAMRPLSTAHVQQFVYSEMTTWPAILVARCTEGYLVVDGNHRWQAAQLSEAETIQARCHAFADANEVISTAFRANLAHGLPASPSVRGAYACWLHTTFPALSQEQIARLSCLTQGAVSKALAKQAAHQQDATSASVSVKQATRRFLVAAARFVEEVASFPDEEVRQRITPEDHAKLERLVRLLDPGTAEGRTLHTRQFALPGA